MFLILLTAMSGCFGHVIVKHTGTELPAQQCLVVRQLEQLTLVDMF